jgi:uncharacterized membrane protein
MALGIIAVIGFLFVLFVPGFLLSMMLFSSMRHMDRFLLSFGLSVAIVAFIGFSLGTGAFGIQGGINAFNVWISLLIVSGVLGVIILVQRL